MHSSKFSSLSSLPWKNCQVYNIYSLLIFVLFCFCFAVLSTHACCIHPHHSHPCINILKCHMSMEDWFLLIPLQLFTNAQPYLLLRIFLKELSVQLIGRLCHLLLWFHLCVLCGMNGVFFFSVEDQSFLCL